MKYAIISVDDNPEYTGLLPYVTKRWNDIRYCTIIVNVIPSDHYSLNFSFRDHDPHNVVVDLRYKVHSEYWVLWRHFATTIARFFIAGHPYFRNDVIIISDADLYPINSKSIDQPTIRMDTWKEVYDGYLVSTCMYPDNHRVYAAYIYGLGETFVKLFGEVEFPKLMEDAVRVAHKTARMYLTDEDYLNYKLDNSDVKIHKLWNRKHIEGVGQMFNLYDFMIDKLVTPGDLAPFIEMHNMRTSTMTQERWIKLQQLLIGYDQLDVTPPNYYYELIENPLTDTRFVEDKIILNTNK